MVILTMENDLNILVRRFLEHLEIERNCSKLTIRNYEHYLNILIDFCVYFFDVIICILIVKRLDSLDFICLDKKELRGK